jgi:hypothetical protein
LVENLG